MGKNGTKKNTKDWKDIKIRRFNEPTQTKTDMIIKPRISS